MRQVVNFSFVHSAIWRCKNRRETTFACYLCMVQSSFHPATPFSAPIQQQMASTRPTSLVVKFETVCGFKRNEKVVREIRCTSLWMKNKATTMNRSIFIQSNSFNSAHKAIQVQNIGQRWRMQNAIPVHSMKIERPTWRVNMLWRCTVFVFIQPCDTRWKMTWFQNGTKSFDLSRFDVCCVNAIFVDGKNSSNGKWIASEMGYATGFKRFRLWNNV